MYRDARDAAVALNDLTGMKPGAHLESMCTRRVTDVPRTRHRTRGRVEAGDQFVASSEDHMAAALADAAVRVAMVLAQQIAPPRIAHLRRELGRADDIDEQTGRQHRTVLQRRTVAAVWLARTTKEPAGEADTGGEQHPRRPERAATGGGPDADADDVGHRELGDGVAQPGAARLPFLVGDATRILRQLPKHPLEVGNGLCRIRLRGAVREFIEMVLRTQNRWDTVMREYVPVD